MLRNYDVVCRDQYSIAFLIGRDNSLGGNIEIECETKL